MCLGCPHRGFHSTEVGGCWLAHSLHKPHTQGQWRPASEATQASLSLPRGTLLGRCPFGPPATGPSCQTGQFSSGRGGPPLTLTVIFPGLFHTLGSPVSSLTSGLGSGTTDSNSHGVPSISCHGEPWGLRAQCHASQPGSQQSCRLERAYAPVWASGSPRVKWGWHRADP